MSCAVLPRGHELRAARLRKGAPTSSPRNSQQPLLLGWRAVSGKALPAASRAGASSGSLLWSPRALRSAPVPAGAVRSPRAWSRPGRTRSRPRSAAPDGLDELVTRRDLPMPACAVTRKTVAEGSSTQVSKACSRTRSSISRPTQGVGLPSRVRVVSSLILLSQSSGPAAPSRHSKRASSSAAVVSSMATGPRGRVGLGLLLQPLRRPLDGLAEGGRLACGAAARGERDGRSRAGAPGARARSAPRAPPDP